MTLLKIAPVKNGEANQNSNGVAALVLFSSTRTFVDSYMYCTVELAGGKVTKFGAIHSISMPIFPVESIRLVQESAKSCS